MKTESEFSEKAFNEMSACGAVDAELDAELDAED